MKDELRIKAFSNISKICLPIIPIQEATGWVNHKRWRHGVLKNGSNQQGLGTNSHNNSKERAKVLALQKAYREISLNKSMSKVSFGDDLGNIME